MTEELNSDPAAAIAALQAENARLNAELAGMKDDNRYVPRDRLNQESAKRKEYESKIAKYDEDMKRIVGMNMGYEQRLKEYESSGERVKELEKEMEDLKAMHSTDGVLLADGVKDEVTRRVLRAMHAELDEPKPFDEWWGEFKGSDSPLAKAYSNTETASATEESAAATTGTTTEAAADGKRLPGNEGAKPAPPPAQGVTLADITDPSRFSKEQFDEWRKSSSAL